MSQGQSREPSAKASPVAERRQHKRFIEEVLSPGRHDRLEQFLEPEAAAKFRKAERLRRSLFPDLTYEVQDLVADGALPVGELSDDATTIRSERSKV